MSPRGIFNKTHLLSLDIIYLGPGRRCSGTGACCRSRPRARAVGDLSAEGSGLRARQTKGGPHAPEIPTPTPAVNLSSTSKPSPTASNERGVFSFCRQGRARRPSSRESNFVVCFGRCDRKKSLNLPRRCLAKCVTTSMRTGGRNM